MNIPCIPSVCLYLSWPPFLRPVYTSRVSRLSVCPCIGLPSSDPYTRVIVRDLRTCFSRRSDYYPSKSRKKEEENFKVDVGVSLEGGEGGRDDAGHHARAKTRVVPRGSGISFPLSFFVFLYSLFCPIFHFFCSSFFFISLLIISFLPMDERERKKKREPTYEYL